MLTRRTLLSGFLASSAITAAVPVAQAARRPGFPLLTPEEAATRRAEPLTRGLRAVKNDGPGIQVAAPQGDRLTSPINFDVTFTPRNGATPDLRSLRIEYKFGPFWKDITAPVLQAARIQGTRLRAAGAELPEGRHVIRMRIKDSMGRETVTRMDLTVTA